MTVQVSSAYAGKSKAALRSALHDNPGAVIFHDPGMYARKSHFTGADIAPGDAFPVVMDPDTRRRFAQVVRTSAGFRVL